MGEAVQTIPRRLLGGELKRLRLAAGKSQEEAAKAIGKDRTRINKLEDGRSNLTLDELTKLLDFLGASKGERQKIVGMGEEARRRQPRRAYVDLLPGSYRRIANLETQASQILTYERGIFPGLLQCADYAEALIAACDGVWWPSSYQERVNRVAFRLDRQRAVFESTPAKELVFLFTDDALATEFGSPDVMRRQLEHLLSIIDTHPNVRIQVLSTTARNSPAPHCGFTLLHFDRATTPVGFASVAYGPSPYLDEPADTEALQRAFTKLQQMASDPAESKALLATALEKGRT